MNKILSLHIYVNKEREMILVSNKITKEGYRLASEPYTMLESEEWDKVGICIKNMMKKIMENPIVDSTAETADVMKKICGKKSFKQFSKNNICIAVRFNVQENTYIISNMPRLSDGSYGVRKNTISQQYSSKYECGCDGGQIKKNFLKAYAEANRYLYAIGELKEPDIDFEFGHKATWIAVKDISLDFVLDSGRIANVEYTSWKKGLDTVENAGNKIFISGPYEGWLVIAGKVLPDLTRPQEVINLLKELSCSRNEICYFCSYETVGLYGFARMLGGEVDRMYGYLGESGHICVNMGKRSQAEQELLLNFADKDEGLFADGYDDISEEDILKIASKWCVNPESLVGTKEKACFIADFLVSIIDDHKK